MGTFNANINLSSPDVLSSQLTVGVGISVEADSGNLTRVKMAATSASATNPGPVTVYKGSDKLDAAYVYIKNMSDVEEEYAYVFGTKDSSDTPNILKLGGGQFAFMPVESSITLKAYGTKVDQIIEYGVFGRDSSNVTLA